MYVHIQAPPRFLHHAMAHPTHSEVMVHVCSRVEQSALGTDLLQDLFMGHVIKHKGQFLLSCQLSLGDIGEDIVRLQDLIQILFAAPVTAPTSTPHPHTHT